MSDWYHRLQHSRRARNASLAAITVMLMGSTSGALLANFTVAGMNRVASPDPVRAVAVRDDPEWLREASEGFSPQAPEAGYSDASY